MTKSTALNDQQQIERIHTHLKRELGVSSVAVQLLIYLLTLHNIFDSHSLTNIVFSTKYKHSFGLVMSYGLLLQIQKIRHQISNKTITKPQKNMNINRHHDNATELTKLITQLKG